MTVLMVGVSSFYIGYAACSIVMLVASWIGASL
jgi:hypothetical protein